MLILCGLFLGALAVLSAKTQAEERADAATRQSAEQLAAEFGLDFTPRVPSAWIDQLPGCFVFTQGVSREVEHRLTGTHRGWPISLFEFTYYDRGRYGQSIQLGIDLVLVVSLAEHPLPAIQLLPLSFGELVAETVLGTDRVVFEGSEAGQRFSREYSLWVDDRPAVEALFTTEVVCWFADHPGRHFWSGDGQAVIWSPRWRGRYTSRTSEDWRAFLEQAIDMLAVLTRRS